MFIIVICDSNEDVMKQIGRVICKKRDMFNDELSVKMFTDGELLLQYCRHERADMIFLGVKLNNISGIEVSRILRSDVRYEHTQLVYIAEKGGHERELFEFRPLNLLEKPLSEAKIIENTVMAYQYVQGRVRYFAFVKDYYIEHIKYEDIILLKTDGKDLILYTMSGGIDFRSSVSKAEQQLHMPEFVRISQSAIVNVSYIEDYNGSVVTMSNGMKLAVSRRRKKQVNAAYVGYIHGSSDNQGR